MWFKTFNSNIEIRLVGLSIVQLGRPGLYLFTVNDNESIPLRNLRSSFIISQQSYNSSNKNLKAFVNNVFQLEKVGVLKLNWSDTHVTKIFI